MLLKCVGTDDVTILDHRNPALEAARAPPPGGIGILTLVIETAASIHGLDYRCAPARLQALCFGAEDLAADLGGAPRDAAGGYATPVRCARMLTLLAATAAGVPALDTPFTNPRDPADLKREGQAAAADGFAGRLCIHPGQIAAVRAAFTPDPERVRWAWAVRDAFAAAPDAGVLTLDGRTIEGMHLGLARKILAQASSDEPIPDSR